MHLNTRKLKAIGLNGPMVRTWPFMYQCYPAKRNNCTIVSRHSTQLWTTNFGPFANPVCEPIRIRKSSTLKRLVYVCLKLEYTPGLSRKRRSYLAELVFKARVMHELIETHELTISTIPPTQIISWISST